MPSTVVENFSRFIQIFSTYFSGSRHRKLDEVDGIGEVRARTQNNH